MSVLAIDFGTSRIKAAYWDEAKGEAVVLPLGKGGRLYVPSLFHVSKDGKIRFGDEAEVMLHHDPSGVVENLKLKLGKPLQNLPNGRQAASSELMALLFGNIIEHSMQVVKSFDGKPPEKIVLTYPALLDYTSIYKDALSAVGYNGEVVYLREPEAAAWAWVKEEKRASGDVLVVLDFGGGTIDWATLCIDEQRHPRMIAELPAGGITAAGAHVDDGLFDEMMKRINDVQRANVLAHRALVVEQIRQMKESLNGYSTLSGKDSQELEIQLGEDVYTYERKVFDKVVQRELLDQALVSIDGYVTKVVKHLRGKGGETEICCALVGGTRLLSGLELQVKKRVTDICKANGIAVTFTEIGQADFATVKGGASQLFAGDVTYPTEDLTSGVIDDKSRKKNLLTLTKKILSFLLIVVAVVAIAFGNILWLSYSDTGNTVFTRFSGFIHGIPDNFVLIQSGEFTMGSPRLELNRDSLEVQDTRDVRAFYISKYEVTQAEWESVTGTNPSYFKGANLPVENVSWEDCQEFIKMLNLKTGKRYRLPTEKEWEYACRAGTITPFNTGFNLNTEQANYNGRYPYGNNLKGQYRGKTVAVDSFAPNAWGLYNMHGNVWEWCSNEDGTYITNVVRGGGWSNEARFCRSAGRTGIRQNIKGNSIGFRLVLDPWS